jgi:dolichyl-phosphate beta-glucosyltransferase
MHGMDLSIVIPAFNEEQRIGRMLDAYLPYFSERYEDHCEFLVVINGSTDETERVVREREGRYPQLRHPVEPDRIGKGGAIVVGFREAAGNLIGFIDADGATAPESFDDLIDALLRLRLVYSPFRFLVKYYTPSVDVFRRWPKRS